MLKVTYSATIRTLNAKPCQTVELRFGGFRVWGLPGFPGLELRAAGLRLSGFEVDAVLGLGLFGLGCRV